MRAVIQALGRPQATGETRRVESWTAIPGAARAEVHVVRLLDHRPNPRSIASLTGLVKARVVPEPALKGSVRP